jgi:hypothetical protein
VANGIANQNGIISLTPASSQSARPEFPARQDDDDFVDALEERFVVAERRWKSASYEVAGNAPAIITRPERTMDFRRPFRT